MNEQELNRLKKLLFYSWLLIIILVTGLVVWFSFSLKDVQQSLGIVSKQPGPQGTQGQIGLQGVPGLTVVGAQGLQGPQGAQGLQGQQGTAGSQGLQGEAGTPGSPGATGAQGPQGERGPEGQQGPQGPAGRTVYQRTNPITLQEECRYAGDEDWQPAEECR